MGWETANMHLGSGKKSAILKYSRKISPAILNENATAMVKALQKDWKHWREWHKSSR